MKVCRLTAGPGSASVSWAGGEGWVLRSCTCALKWLQEAGVSLSEATYSGRTLGGLVFYSTAHEGNTGPTPYDLTYVWHLMNKTN